MQKLRVSIKITLIVLTIQGFVFDSCGGISSEPELISVSRSCIWDAKQLHWEYDRCMENIVLPAKKLRAKHLDRSTVCTLAEHAEVCLKKLNQDQCAELIESEKEIPLDIRIKTAAAILRYACFKFEETKRVIKSSKNICPKLEFQSCYDEMMNESTKLIDAADKHCKLVRFFVKCAKKSSRVCKPKMRRTMKEVMRFVLDSYNCPYCGII